MPSMTFLGIVQRAYRESGLSGSGPVSVLNQAGRKADVVDWCIEAYEGLQNMRPDWSFNWSTTTFALTINDDTYVPDTSIAEFRRDDRAAYSYPTAQGVNGRLFMQFREWEDFRGMQVPPAAGSQPIIYTVRPDGQLQYYPVPSVACTVVHEVKLVNQVLAADADVPRIPANTHMAIVWKAVMIGCGKTNNFSRFDTSEENYSELEDILLRDCIPKTAFRGGPLA